LGAQQGEGVPFAPALQTKGAKIVCSVSFVLDIHSERHVRPLANQPAPTQGASTEKPKTKYHLQAEKPLEAAGDIRE